MPFYFQDLNYSDSQYIISPEYHEYIYELGKKNKWTLFNMLPAKEKNKYIEMEYLLYLKGGGLWNR